MVLTFKHKLAIKLLKLLSRSWRFKIEGRFPAAPAIVVFWHGLMLPVWKKFAFRQSNAVVSLSRDGEILSTLLEEWDYYVIRGSSNKGGKEVLNQMIELAPKGYLLITPDGPTGPIFGFKPGAVVTSHRTGVPIVFCSVNISRSRIFENSWDKFRLPMPFSKIKLIFSKPYIIPEETPKEELDRYISECNGILNKMRIF